MNTLGIMADAPGVIEGQCSEFCGQGHALIGFVVDVRTPEEYAAALTALAQGREPEPAPEWVPPRAVGAAAPAPPPPLSGTGTAAGGPPGTGPQPVPAPPPPQGRAGIPTDIPATVLRESSP